MSTNTFDRLRELVCEIKDLDEDDIQRDTLIKDLNFDSLDFVELQVTVKKECNFTMNQTFFTEKTTFGDLCDHIDGKE
ncbi:acyl carrier protein [Acetobacteraceae bacterium ESL0709]|nr:acyl carrier protein [Acetobacteraceae bacterium ESL0697]MDF7678590.1 acyl carrier protein [Acetobacteraceae bacterium ESL0709]